MTTTSAGPAYNLSRQAREAENVLDHITDRFDDNPQAMAYFYELFRRVYCQGEALPRQGTLVGTTCIHAPEELIYAMGATPVRLCNGSYHYDQIGADFMPAKSCSLVKATLGMLGSENAIPRVGKLDLVVNPTTCDQKKKAGAMIEGMGYSVHDLELPPAKESEESRLYWQRSVRQFALRLGRLTGNKLTRKGLKAAMARTAHAQAAFRTLHNLRKSSPALFLGKDAFLVTNAFFFDDIERWTEAVEKLNAELAERQKNGFQAAQRKAPRILFTGSPPIFPNLKLPLLIEEAGGVVVADETCSANRMLYDMTAVDEWRVNDMVDGLADRYLKPCTCPIFTRNDDRQRRLLELAASFNADGVVYQAFSGCQVYEMEQRSIAEALNARRIPMLYIETDYSPDDMGQLSTRIEAFLESIKARKRKRA
ncbi:MAG: double-cubane-cluster-containing anaerobic reductase [Gammaproteobacteria bacterium]|nr:double-cubane-cluster-containing anaerobic reductase [Gammaproteobacteria bacterium]MCW8957622.1 double-cubane-cluster-containing anaerobic reductase [Gammaproteobacteria bacterium]MCW8972993.1 double-cubane-cluster-containing anaerobic reductase [Gammaproteobacteria bacterium]MCW8992960.1 double-cubane-cluster-containing anaerobic reductase [Gammaproteobacteria bacterium]